WRSSASRCTPPRSPRPSAPGTSPASMSRCSSCKARATPWPRCLCSPRRSSGWGRSPPSCPSAWPTTPSTCRRDRAGATAKSSTRRSTRWWPGWTAFSDDGHRRKQGRRAARS
ncbi:MAG: FIG00439997: hypothetical protein, partial [uncultured Acetobacteraceae bacterium]